jgi:hypothetical protein
MKASIHVTRAHLTHGTPGSPDDCAIARAIQDSFQDVCNPWVCYDVVYFMDLEGRCYEGVLPTRECEWVRLLFDRNILPGPKTFQLEYRRITRKTYDRARSQIRQSQIDNLRMISIPVNRGSKRL